MTKVTKTLNPVHFEDLEPHRFEDLIRQLVYDLKNWRLLEPTGRLGSDDGYDARGQEIVVSTDSEETESDDLDDTSPDKTETDRLWQIQCKREKTITPKKISKYLSEMITEMSPYGVIFAAPCDFSKKTRDAFINKIREKGVQEFYLWGKADLEDLLFQPKNDHLLYAYFGISLTIRKRSLKSKIRNILAIKKKVVTHLGKVKERSYKEVLLRKADDTNYLYSKSVPNFNENPSWKKYFFVGHYHDGIILRIRRFYAYRDTDGKTGKLKAWDYTEETNVAAPFDDIWNKREKNNYNVHAFWTAIPKENQAYFDIDRLIPYEKILEIDPSGDEYAQCPHIYVEPTKNIFFLSGSHATLRPPDYFGFDPNWISREDDKLRIKYFPKIFPESKPEPLPPMGKEK